ncbi:MAG: DUF1573 domain-containing protein [Planctomycetota bacterium]
MRNLLGKVLACVVLASTGPAVALPPPLPEIGSGFAAPQSKAKITFDLTNHDFGLVWDHEQASIKFPFKNVGEENLIIMDMKSTCGCTVPALEKTEYAPGEGGEITVIFNPKGRNGINQRTVTITTNDPAGPQRLSIRAEVKPVLRVETQFVRFHTEKGGTAVEKVSVSGRGEAFDATYGSSAPAGLATVSKTGSEVYELNGETWRRVDFDVTTVSSAPVGRSQTVLTFETTDSRRDTFTVQAILDVKGDLEVKPQRVSLGRITIGEMFEKQFTVASRSASDFKITKIDVIGDLYGKMTFDWAPVDPKNPDAFRVTLKGAPDKEQRQSGKIVVHTNVVDEPEIDIAYYGWVPAQARAPQPPARPAVAGGNP